ncbi:DUF4244 domain-containing protein [Nostocoides sp.]|jgi:hypothetical protein|uniref:DUF4244 domain-containing protein n=1 Tax=Nostocoides sp. TaxID=1917966 RepID=UPI002D18FE0C|nr:DUF4244 domain-containing protein [Tetrasphaera sp.]
MSHQLAARFTTARSRLVAPGARRSEAGLTTIEWALVTLMVCAFCVTALGVLGSTGAKAIGDIIARAFSKGDGA